MKETRALRIDSALGLRRPPARRRPWQMLARFSGALVFALVFGLVLGALVHIVTVFAIPYMGTNDAVTRLSREAAQVPGPAEPGRDVFGPPWPDPAFVTIICRFDLTGGPMRIRSRAPEGYAGLSLHAPGGSVLYAVTDEVAQGGDLSLLVMTPDQALDAVPGDGEEVRFVVPPRHGVVPTQGLAVYRVMAPLPSQREQAREIASTLRCDAY